MRPLILAICFSLMTGCATPSFTSGSSPKMSESWEKSVIPVAVGEVQGKQVAMYETHVAVNRQITEQKKPFLQRIWGWFIGLGVLGGALAFFFPTLFFAFILWLMKKWANLKKAYELNRTALEETVEGIKKANAVTPEVAKVMDDTTSDTTKQIVGKIKAVL